MRILLKRFLCGVAVIILVSQLSYLLVAANGGVAGSFGVRQMSHRCIGWQMDSKKAMEVLPEGDIEFRLLLFHFRYSVLSDNDYSNRVYCIGQDIWYGE